MATEFKIPELGENIKTGEVVKINVTVGQSVAKDQPVLELETDKAVIDVPSSVSGKVTAVLVKIGDKVAPGQVAFLYEGQSSTSVEAPKNIKPQETVAETPPENPKKIVPVAVSVSPEVETQKNPVEPKVASLGAHHSLAAPSVRKLAREIGVDVDQVAGSGSGGRITLDDVKAAARRVQLEGSSAQGVVMAVSSIELPDFAKYGVVERKAMTSVRRKTAERMSVAWQTIPHVTQHDDADITELESLRQQFGKRAESAGGHLTVTVIVLKIVAAALKKFPHFNASVDMASQEIIYKKYVNIGVAVDTDRGLIVPVIRDVDKKNIIVLSSELTQSAERARNKKTTLDEMQGGSFTITNLGGIGGCYFTPIINPPEVAILGLGRWRYQQVYVNGQFQARKVLPLSLSYDHRVIDGADAARFLRWIADAVNEPFLMDLEG